MGVQYPVLTAIEGEGLIRGKRITGCPTYTHGGEGVYPQVFAQCPLPGGKGVSRGSGLKTCSRRKDFVEFPAPKHMHTEPLRSRSRHPRPPCQPYPGNGDVNAHVLHQVGMGVGMGVAVLGNGLPIGR